MFWMKISCKIIAYLPQAQAFNGTEVHTSMSLSVLLIRNILYSHLSPVQQIIIKGFGTKYSFFSHYSICFVISFFL